MGPAPVALGRGSRPAHGAHAAPQAHPRAALGRGRALRSARRPARDAQHLRNLQGENRARRHDPQPSRRREAAAGAGGHGMKPANLLVIMSDEHDPRWMGCSGSALMHTPNLDRLAARGLRFTDAYTTCPICVPARAAFAVGKYIHEIGYWDNADPYDGAIPS